MRMVCIMLEKTYFPTGPVRLRRSHAYLYPLSRVRRRDSRHTRVRNNDRLFRCAGRLPPAEDDGVSYLKIPLNALGKPKAGEGKKT